MPNSSGFSMQLKPLGEMINAMEDAYNNMGNTHNANLMVEGSAETGFIYDISYTWTNSGATTPFY
jgi:hypothetical protein